MDDLLKHLPDEWLNAVNASFDWDHHTLDSLGRKVGNPNGRHYPIPHPLVLTAAEWLGLEGKSVVEFGSLEGAHTVALCQLSREVTAVDVRVQNLVKTIIRCGLYGCRPKYAILDVEEKMPPEADVYFHSGVLYHLQDPVHHLRQIGRRCRSLLLDTHYADKPDDPARYRSADGRPYDAKRHKEEVSEIRAAVRPFSYWLTLDTIKAVLGDHFSDVAVLSEREERNGLRCTIVAKGGRGAR